MNSKGHKCWDYLEDWFATSHVEVRSYTFQGTQVLRTSLTHVEVTSYTFLRRIQNLDGTPVEIDFTVKPGKVLRVRNAYRNCKFTHEVGWFRGRRIPHFTWASSLLVLPKSGTGDLRLMVDYRGLGQGLDREQRAESREQRAERRTETKEGGV